MTTIYLDHAATTPVHPEVSATHIKMLESVFGNPSSIHSYGREFENGLMMQENYLHSPSMQNRRKSFLHQAELKRITLRFSEL